MDRGPPGEDIENDGPELSEDTVFAAKPVVQKTHSRSVADSAGDVCADPTSKMQSAWRCTDTDTDGDRWDKRASNGK